MSRGDLYRVAKPSARDPRRFRVFVVASRQVLIDSTVVDEGASSSMTLLQNWAPAR